jgi:hypothetical protein
MNDELQIRASDESNALLAKGALGHFVRVLAAAGRKEAPVLRSTGASIRGVGELARYALTHR